MGNVFISYSHDSKDHSERVLVLANRLRADGLDCVLDQYETSPAEGWPKWMDRRLKEAEQVIIICTETYWERVMDEESPGKGKGVKWESTLAYQYIYDDDSKNTRFIPVVFDTENRQYIPTILKGATFYCLDTDEGYDDLYRRLTNQPRVKKPGIGTIKDLPPETPDTPVSREAVKVSTYKLPVTTGGLFGRERELALLDDSWADGNRHIVTLVAWGGVGKTALVNEWLNHMQRKNYWGARRVYGWSFYSQGAEEGKQASADEFLHETLVWFGDIDPGAGSNVEKGRRLARLVREQKTLLVLDGLEPLQYPPGEVHGFDGKLKDPGLAAFLKELAASCPGGGDADQCGLCVVTTREGVTDLAHKTGHAVMEVMLEHLSDEAGAALLRGLGVTTGTGADVRAAVKEYGGHALALTLLGNYIRSAHHGDIRKRDKIPRLTGERLKGGHARRVMEAYERWLGESVERDVLYILGLFDRPAEGGAVEALKSGPAIPGVTDHLVGLSEEDWEVALINLRTARLLGEADAQRSGTLDCHPLVREHFGERLREKNPGGWQAAHERLYRYFKALPEKELPDTLAEMEPLFAAVAHGCKAGRHREALVEVYWNRIRRGDGAYTVHKLGAFGSDLAALSHFFEIPWRQLAAGLTEEDHAVVLSWTAYCLRAVGRLRESIQPLMASKDIFLQQNNWKSASSASSNLSELMLVIGEISMALDLARTAVGLSNRSGNSVSEINNLTTLAYILYLAGEQAEADATFREAENKQKKTQPSFPYLYSISGFRYCLFLLGEGKNDEALERSKQCLDIALQQFGGLVPTALANLSYGFALWHIEKDKSGDYNEALNFLNVAVEGLRTAGIQDYLIQGLLLRASIYREINDYTNAQDDLSEVEEMAVLGQMNLFLTDLYLEKSRLSLMESNRPEFELNFDKARDMIWKLGYRAKENEIFDIELALSGKEKTQKEESLEAKLRNSVLKKYYADAKKILEEIVRKDILRSKRLKEEFGFIFNINKKMNIPGGVDKRSEIDWYRKIWLFLAEGNKFAIKMSRTDLPGEKKETKIDEEKPNKIKTTSFFPSMDFNVDKKINSYSKGKKLEESMVDLFRYFFSMSKESESNILELDHIMRESAGPQYGHDIRLGFSFTDNAKYSQKRIVKCHVECKYYQKAIRLKEIADKVAMEEMHKTEIEHWILISPASKPTSTLAQMVDFWNKNRKYSFNIQIWSPANNVEEFFGLLLDVFDYFYPNGISKCDPHTWNKKRQEKIFLKWRNKLKPVSRLPRSWQDYLFDTNHLFLENDSKSDLLKLFQTNKDSYVPMKCKDSHGDVLNTPLEEYVENWLEEKGNRSLLLLGEFGDGKTAFTYILTRKLVKKYIEDSEGWIPIRFSLANCGGPNELLINRLSRFGADLADWFFLENNEYKVLIMLDGFDEMSIEMDPMTLKKNVDNLEELYNKLKWGKVIITSRKHFIKNPAEVEMIRERIGNPPLIHLAPLPRYAVVKHIEKSLTNLDQRKQFHKILKLNDPVGLARKPFFLKLVKETLVSESFFEKEPDDLTELNLYENYVHRVLQEKAKLLDDPKVLRSRKSNIQNMIRLMEDIAWELHFKKSSYILLSGFKNIYGDLAEKLWEMGQQEDLNVEKDAENRIGIRSLLKFVAVEELRDEWSVAYCHRSMREYFIAKKIIRYFEEEQEKLKEILSRILLNNEIMDFLVGIMRKDNIKKWSEYLCILLKDCGLEKQNRYLGGNVVTLLYRLNNNLPDNITYSNLLLDHSDLENADLSLKSFNSSWLRNSNLNNVNFEGADFSNCNLIGANFEETSSVQVLQALPEEQKIIAAYSDNSIREWDISHTRKNKCNFTIRENGGIKWLGLSPKKGICTLLKDSIVFFKRSETGSPQQMAKFFIKPEYTAIKHKNNTLMVIAEKYYSHSQAYLFDLNREEIVSYITFPGASACEFISKDVFVYSNDREELVIVDLRDKENSPHIRLPTGMINCLCSKRVIESDEYLLAYGQKNGNIAVWRIKGEKSKWDYEAIFGGVIHKGAVNNVEFYDEEHIVSGGEDRKIIVSNFKDENRIDNLNKRIIYFSLNCRGMITDRIEGPHEKEILEGIKKKQLKK